MYTIVKLMTLALLFSLQSLVAQDTGDLTVRFENVKETKGELYVGIFEKDNFLRQPTIGKMVKVDTNGSEVTFEGVAYGSYAISVFHDLNGNKTMDRESDGMPSEPWAMSGSVDPNQYPTWDGAKFELNSKKQEFLLEF
ncbi:hypothetical protein P700755_003080 [Psychroflexus torquis ATCC 700755]|uniref:DUF2141 domain-containing protein n=1 Tax=Psychroflexus torquis (strain ATCC 700755 / CIP 106069 / ACAM 623) TaxID=313595 RepID=K4IWA3_PSYTT|nr:DUF2141 domain-containing protein [Psychroflexus torquis]AFU69750.1 hypothetical protein P700755_003080 [Psychroflexus torquis ATCC 700755]